MVEVVHLFDNNGDSLQKMIWSKDLQGRDGKCVLLRHLSQALMAKWVNRGERNGCLGQDVAVDGDVSVVTVPSVRSHLEPFKTASRLCRLGTCFFNRHGMQGK